MDKAPKHPTVLWKLSAGGYLKFRSPRFQGRIIRENGLLKWLVETDRLNFKVDCKGIMGGF